MSRALPSIPEAVLNSKAILGQTIEVGMSTVLPAGPYRHTIARVDEVQRRDITVTQELDGADGDVAYSRSITVYGAQLRQDWADDGALAIHADGERAEVRETGTLTTVTWPG